MTIHLRPARHRLHRRTSLSFVVLVVVSVVMSVGVLSGCEATVSGTATAPSISGKFRPTVTFDPCTDFPQAAFDTLGVKRRETGDQRADITVPYTEAEGGPEMHIGCDYLNDKFRLTIWAENVGLEARRHATGKEKIWDTTLNGRNAVVTIPDTWGTCNIYVEVPGGAITILLDNTHQKDAATADECAAVVNFMTLLEPFFPQHI